MAAKKKRKGGFQLPLPVFLPKSEWSPPSIEEGAVSWKGAKRVCLDIETRDDHLRKLGIGVRRGGYIAGVSYAIEDGPCNYLPIRHDGGDNCDWDVLQYLRDQSRDFTGTLVTSNGQYDLDYTTEVGAPFDNVEWVRDITIAEPLIDELQYQYGMDAIAGRYGMPGKDEALLRQAAEVHNADPKAELWRLPARYVGAYAEQDTRLPLDILRKQERIIDDQNLWEVYNLESEVLPVLVRMRRRGVRVDLPVIDEIYDWAGVEIHKCLAEIKTRTGVTVGFGDLSKVRVTSQALKAIGVNLPKTPTGKDSVTADLLQSIDHPVPKALLRAKQLDKLRGTFCDGIRRYQIDGRIYCTFNQLRRQKDESTDTNGAAYGRLSSCNPNLQQQPIRNKEYGKRWRSIYLPEEGRLWACNDFSQQEPRFVVHFAEMCEMEGSTSAGNQYRMDPTTDNHQMMSEMANIPRDDAKIIFLGLCYNMGGAKLCHSLGLPTEWITNRNGDAVEVAGPEGKALLKRFNSAVPFVKLLSKRCETVAAKRGYIKTAAGRRCRFPRDNAGNYDWTSLAMNRLIQGSAADQTKRAMVAAEKAGFEMQLQVHDEIDLSVDSPGEAHELAQAMRDAMRLSVPTKVDVEIGHTWGTIQKQRPDGGYDL